jgi:hypothetical protein
MILKRFLTLNNLIMKTRKLLTILLGLFVAAMIISCENNDDIVMPEGQMP